LHRCKKQFISKWKRISYVVLANRIARPKWKKLLKIQNQAGTQPTCRLLQAIQSRTAFKKLRSQRRSSYQGKRQKPAAKSCWFQESYKKAN